MTLTLQDLTRDLSQIDLSRLSECWKWKTNKLDRIITVTVLGDLFYSDSDKNICWLRTDDGTVSIVAKNITEFYTLLDDEEQFDEWFLPLLVEKLIAAGKKLNDTEVYSVKKPTILGGTLTVDNIEPTDIYTHFFFYGNLCEQLKDLPDGTKVTIKYE